MSAFIIFTTINFYTEILCTLQKYFAGGHIFVTEALQKLFGEHGFKVIKQIIESTCNVCYILEMKQLLLMAW